jgi:hypothetical protein
VETDKGYRLNLKNINSSNPAVQGRFSCLTSLKTLFSVQKGYKKRGGFNVKKWLALLLVVVFVFAVTGCGTPTPPADDTGDRGCTGWTEGWDGNGCRNYRRQIF